MTNVFIHQTAEVSPNAVIGKNSQIWHQAQIRENVTIGKECIIGKGVYIDKGVQIGNRVKIQNYACIYKGSIIKDKVFIGPGVILANDKYPKSTNLKGLLKKEKDWPAGTIIIEEGASLGAGVIVLPNVTIGLFAMVGAGSVVTTSIPPHALIIGNPGRLAGYVCYCGNKLNQIGKNKHQRLTCPICKQSIFI